MMKRHTWVFTERDEGTPFLTNLLTKEPPDRLGLLDIVVGDNNEVDRDSSEDDGTANA